MKVSLIRPPTYSAGLMGAQLVPFLGITYLAAAVRQAGYKVDIIDMCAEDIDRTEIVRNRYVAYGMSFSSLKQRLRGSDVIGFTCMFSQDWIFHKELIAYVRRLFPESLIIAGGEHISALPEYCLEDSPELDICVVGEGEKVFVELLNVLKKKGELSEVPSLVYRMPKKGSYYSTPRAERIKDINKIPIPAWDLIPLENYLSRELNYHLKRGRTIPMLASRGCPYQCSFCSNTKMWGNPWLMREPVLIVDEMEYYINRYRANNFVFSDLTAVIDREAIINLCNEILKRKFYITWQLPTLRTEAVDYSILELMYQAGCRELDFAIESGSKKVLVSVNKRNDPSKIFSLVKDGLDVGMNLSTNIVVGLPQEGFREFLSTYWLMIKLALMGMQELNAFPFIPYPGSKLFNIFFDNKRIILNDDYFFNLFGYADLSRAVSWSANFGPKTLCLMRLILLISFYSFMFITHPKRILKLITNIFKGTTTTKFEGVIQRIFKNISVSFSKGNLN